MPSYSFFAFFVIILTTPPIALLPYITLPAPLITSMRSMSSTGMLEIEVEPSMSVPAAIPSTRIFTYSELKPCMLTVSVGFAELCAFTVISGTERRTSLTVLEPLSLISSAETTLMC